MPPAFLTKKSLSALVVKQDGIAYTTLLRVRQEIDLPALVAVTSMMRVAKLVLVEVSSGQLSVTSVVVSVIAL